MYIPKGQKSWVESLYILQNHTGVKVALHDPSMTPASLIYASRHVLPFPRGGGVATSAQAQGQREVVNLTIQKSSTSAGASPLCMKHYDGTCVRALHFLTPALASSPCVTSLAGKSLLSIGQDLCSGYSHVPSEGERVCRHNAP